MESYPKVKRQVSVVENMESRVTPDYVMRVLAVLWLIPAVALFALGMAAVANVPIFEGVDSIQRLQEVRAGVVLLSILTVLVGSIWALRSWDLLPSLKSIKEDSWRFGPRVHGLALAVAAVAIAVGRLTNGGAGGVELVLSWTAAVAAFVAGSMLPRWLRRIGEFSSQSMALFAAVIVYQLTIGWLHMVTWTMVGSMVLVAEGVTMAMICISAAAAIPAFGRRHLRIAELPVSEEPEFEAVVSIEDAQADSDRMESVDESAVVR